MKKATIQTDGILLSFPFDFSTIAQVKQIPGRRYIPKDKKWLIPHTQANIESLISIGFNLPSTQPKSSRILNLSMLRGTLMPFQKEGVEKAVEWRGRVLIGDEMGLGKTVQAIAYMLAAEKAEPTIIICPASLKYNWRNEILKWTHIQYKDILLVEGTKAVPIVDYPVVIINYDVVRKWVPMLVAAKPALIIMDECHYIKNKKAQRSKAVRQLCKGVPQIIGLSGTPIENRPVELYEPISIIHPTLFPNFWHFAMRYCGAKKNGFGWDFSGVSNAAELHEILSNSIMIRRKKTDVLKDLPPKRYSIIPLEITNRAEYNSAEQDLVSWLQGKVDDKYERRKQEIEEAYENVTVALDEAAIKQEKETIAARIGGTETLVRIEYLKQLAAAGKMDMVFSWVDNFLEETDEKLVLFATHRTIIAQVMERYQKTAVKVDGSVTGIKRQEAVDTFQQKKKIRLFVANIKAGGVGLTLTAASKLAFLEYPVNPGQLDQAADRVHRISQKAPVTIYNFVGRDTIEESMLQLIDKKRNAIEQVLDGKDKLDFSLYNELIKNYI